MIAGSTIQGNIIIWDVASAKEVARYLHHTKPCFSCAWSQFDGTLVLSTSSDSTAVVFEVIGEQVEEAISSDLMGSATHKRPSKPVMLMRFVHPAPVFGCAWSTFKRKVFCTGCQDSFIRVFDCSVGLSPQYILSGLNARVFNCAWSPLIPDTIAAGSDDLTIQVWTIEPLHISEAGAYIKSRCILTGHTANVRALSWNYEHQDILLSGSWDRSIRVWDVLNGVCLKYICDHAADVYSLSSHPEKPFVYLSCSRDSTVRVWELDTISTHLKIMCMLDESLVRIRNVGGDPADVGVLTPIVSPQNSPQAGLSFLRYDEGADMFSDFRESSTVNRGRPPTMAIAPSPSISPFGFTRKMTSQLPSLTSPAIMGNKAVSFPSYTGGTTPIVELKKAPPTASERVIGPLSLMIHGRESAKVTMRLQRLLNGGNIDTGTVKRLQNLRMAERYYNIFSLFAGPNGSMDLWEVAIALLCKLAAQAGGDSPDLTGLLLRSKMASKVTFEDDILPNVRSDARKLESLKMMKRGALSNKNIDRLKEAALLNAKMGDFERYCNIMIEIGDYTAALAMAPRVSMAFWTALCSKYSDVLLEKSDEECVPYLMAAGRCDLAVDYYLSKRDTSSGLVIAKAAETLSNPPHPVDVAENIKSVSRSSQDALLQRVVGSLAQNEFHSGNCIVGAAQYIACTGDFGAAIDLLYSCFEYELAYALAHCFEADGRPAALALAYRCSAQGLVSVALELIQRVDQTPEAAGLLVSFSCRTEAQAALFIQSHNLRPIDAWLILAEQLDDRESTVELAVTYLICARKFSVAAAAACIFLRKHIREPLDADARTRQVIGALKHLQLFEVDSALKTKTLGKLFWFCSFEAAKAGSYELAANMLRILRGSSQSGLPLPVADILLQVTFKISLRTGLNNSVVDNL
jgi:WD40 repeat protein